MTDKAMEIDKKEYRRVVIKFAGDSGDGMQLTGNQFTEAAASFGNEVCTLPDFPSEIRGPVGTIAGVSGFQLNFGSSDVNTPGDYPDFLIAMNPAALLANIRKNLGPNCSIIVDMDTFSEKNIAKAGYTSDPFSMPELEDRKVYKLPITSQTIKALEELDMTKKAKERCKNFFTLGVLFWLFDRPAEHTIEWLNTKFAKNPTIAQANTLAIQEGINYARNCGFFQSQYEVKPACLPKGTYRNMTGNKATAFGLVTAAKLAKLPLFLGSYPITPATDILHEVAKLKNYNAITFQAEDEIAGICSTLGAAYAGNFAVTTTSGPGVSLKTEAMGLAVISELPMVIVNVQRGGPSTGLPTKTEQADLLQAMYGRHGESPMPIVAAKSPADCFDAAIEASRIALKYMTPVMLLTDGYLGNGAEPWRIPEVDSLPDLTVELRTDPENYMPYRRNPETMARDWVVPGTPGMAHRIGGLEKDAETGAISHDPDNHNKMVRDRQAKVDNIANDIPDLEIYGDQDGGEVAIVGWGSTFGAIRTKVDHYRKEGKSVSQIHFTHLNPFPKNTEEVLKKFKKVVVAEMNLGQLDKMLKSTFLMDTISLTKIQGNPFREDEIEAVVDKLL